MNVSRKQIAILAIVFFLLGASFMNTLRTWDSAEAFSDGYKRAELDYKIVIGPYGFLQKCNNLTTPVNFTLVNLTP